MSLKNSLWKHSAAWRWTFVLSCLATAIVILCGPWKTQNPVSVRTAHYKSQQQPGSVTATTAGRSNSSLSGYQGYSYKTRDTTFDVAVNRPSNKLPSDTELHVIGVYKGALPEGESEPVWWRSCPRTPNAKEIMDCREKLRRNQIKNPRIVTVNVNRSAVPIVLVLMAYESIVWNIEGSYNANVKRIILGGYKGQKIKGVADHIPVDVYTHQPSYCNNCTRHSDFIYAYKRDSPEYTKSIKKLHSITGLALTSFQGANSSNQFSITNSTAAFSVRKEFSESYTGAYFSNNVLLLNETIPLPDGIWRGVAYTKNTSKHEDNELLVLANIVDGKLGRMIAARVQTVKDGTGFSQKSSCQRQDVYFSKVESNQSFGRQLCYWVNHVVKPWEKPIFKLASANLKKIEIDRPKVLIEAAFHKASKSTAITVFYYTNPEASGISSPVMSWSASPWHKKNIKTFPEKQAFVDMYLDWAKFWFPIIKSMQN